MTATAAAATAAADAEPTAASGRGLRAAIVLALLLALVLLLGAARGDLWLDEIWSVELAKRAHSALEVFTALRHENNHPLNTLFLYLLGDPALQLEYRVASVLSGLLCLSLLARVAWKQWGAREALVAVLLCAVSFPILLYASEARGYAMVMMFAVLAHLAWRRHLETSSIPSLLLFWAASMLGLLAQVTFVIAMLAFGIGQLTIGSETKSLPQRFAALVRVHLLPLLFAAWWYWFFLGRLVVGGGDPSGGWPVIGQSCALLLGLPDNPAFRAAAIAAALLLVAVGVRQLRKERDEQWLFFLAMLLLAPAALLALSYPKDFYPRYFLAAFPFFLLLAAHLACIGWNRFERGGRALLLLLLVVYCAGNLQRDLFLLREGRGGYSKAIAYMLRESPTGPVLVGSDHDFRNGLVLRFHAARLPGGARVQYIDEARAPQVKPEWFLLHSQELAHASPQQISVAGVGVYQLVRSYGYAGLSGWNWYVYRRIA